MSVQCDDRELRNVLQAVQAQAPNAIEQIEALLGNCPQDPRLHFLRGSVLIGLGRHIEAHGALSQAVALAPDYDIARFQLGFFELTSGEAGNALQTWKALDRLPETDPLPKFVHGLTALIHDDFEACIQLLREGIALNAENEPLNRDMELVIDRCLPLIAPDAPEMVSETSLILGQLGARPGDASN